MQDRGGANGRLRMFAPKVPLALCLIFWYLSSFCLCRQSIMCLLSLGSVSRPGSRSGLCLLSLGSVKTLNFVSV